MSDDQEKKEEEKKKNEAAVRVKPKEKVAKATFRSISVRFTHARLGNSRVSKWPNA